MQSNSLEQTTAAATLLQQWLGKRLPPDQYDWLMQSIERTLLANSDRELHITMGLIPRRLGREDLNLSEREVADADCAQAEWRPKFWSLDSAARVLTLCRLASRDEQRFADTIVDLCRSADLAESIALYSGTAVFPWSESGDAQIAEGLRTNMRAVFEAIAHNNPYPARHFDQNRWNHMVLKALFVDSTLAPIIGLDQRSNPELARILCDYAHERWAAGRPVTPELWRCVGPHAEGDMIDDLQRASESDDLLAPEGALLALSTCAEARAQTILASNPKTASQIASGELTWDGLAARVAESPTS